jgi:hypothetical protein
LTPDDDGHCRRRSSCTSPINASVLQRGLGFPEVGCGTVEEDQLLDRAPTRCGGLVDCEPLQRLEPICHAAERTRASTAIFTDQPPRATASTSLTWPFPSHGLCSEAKTGRRA